MKGLFKFMVLSFCMLAASAGMVRAEEEKVLNIYAWSEYIPQESINAF